MIGQALSYLSLLPKLIGTFAYAYVHPNVSLKLKIGALAGIVYFFSPFDLIPDMFTGIGLVDDLILSLLLMQGFLTALPDEVLGPAFKKFGTSRAELSFDVEKALTVMFITAKSLYIMISVAQEKIVEYYGKKGKCEAANAAVADIADATATKLLTEAQEGSAG